jgi:hypothetical protein
LVATEKALACEADGKEIGSYRKGTGLRGENRAMMDRIEQLGAVVDAALDEDYRRHLMSDLKQRLQAASEDHLLADGMLYRMALARIEQLESALKEICSTEKRFTNHGYNIARKALENKDE